jgi:hypothetical protein
MIGNYKKAGYNSVLVLIEGSIFNEDTGVQGLNGLTIQADTSYQPEKRLKCHGKVIKLPVDLSNVPISQASSGFPVYGASRDLNNEDEEISTSLYSTGGNFEFKFMSDIPQEIQEGDKIYFRWRVLMSMGNKVAESKGSPKQWIFKVPYDQIICAVREGKIIPIGSNVLIDPIFESWDEILRPTYYPYKNSLGEPIERPKSEWLQIKVAPGHKERVGKVAHIGSPLKGDRRYMKAGDHVLYKPKLRNMVEIEGGKYFVLRQDQILTFETVTSK